MAKFSTPRGTADILPEDAAYFAFVMEQAREVAELFGYRRLETPTFAETALFSRTSGEGSDIVDKEMYTFRDRDGESMSLRPEGTAPVMRSYLQHGMHKLPQPVKLYYFERMFRYDKPQAGRFREHRQFGCEAIGVEDAYVDVEMIALLVELYGRCKLRNLTLHINTIGDRNCRPRYVADLVAFLESHRDQLSERDRERLVRNPLRVLDSKEKETIPILKDAPRMVDYLCDECRRHWDRLRHGLDVLGIQYLIDHRLVRGLDYYTRTVFEFVPEGEGAQSTVGSGGRYDVLSEAMGGPPIPGVGFGTGIERIVLGIKESGVALEPSHPDVYIAHLGEAADDIALCLAIRLRKAGISTDLALSQFSLKTQMKRAGSSGSRIALIIGDDELAEGSVIVRDLQTGEQQRVRVDDVVDVIRRLT